MIRYCWLWASLALISIKAKPQSISTITRSSVVEADAVVLDDGRILVAVMEKADDGSNQNQYIGIYRQDNEQTGWERLGPIPYQGNDPTLGHADPDLHYDGRGNVFLVGMENISFDIQQSTPGAGFVSSLGSNIFLCKSEDGGKTWSQRVYLHIDRGNEFGDRPLVTTTDRGLVIVAYTLVDIHDKELPAFIRLSVSTPPALEHPGFYDLPDSLFQNKKVGLSSLQLMDEDHLLLGLADASYIYLLQWSLVDRKVVKIDTMAHHLKAEKNVVFTKLLIDDHFYLTSYLAHTVDSPIRFIDYNPENETVEQNILIGYGSYAGLIKTKDRFLITCNRINNKKFFVDRMDYQVTDKKWKKSKPVIKEKAYGAYRIGEYQPLILANGVIYQGFIDWSDHSLLKMIRID